MGKQEFIGVRKAAKMIGVSEAKLRTMHKEKQIRGRKDYRTKNQLKFTPEEIERVIAKKAEEDAINELFRSSKAKRLHALFDELENGKGLARLKAEERIAEIEIDREIDDEDIVIDIDWDITATQYAAGETGEG